MPWKDPKSKEAIEYQKIWWEENKHKKNRDNIRENNRKYSKTEKGKTKIKTPKTKNSVSEKPKAMIMSPITIIIHVNFLFFFNCLKNSFLKFLKFFTLKNMVATRL